MRHVLGAPGGGRTIAPPLGLAGVIALVVGLCGCGASRVEQPTTIGYPAFAVLGPSPSDGDEVPLWVLRSLLESRKPELSSTDIQGARRVSPKAWLMPASEGKLCLARVVSPLLPKSNGQSLPPAVNRSCTGEAEAKAGQLLETQSLSTTFAKRMPVRIVGIVPDGVHRVIARSSDGHFKTAPVTRNAYEAVVINPRSISFVAGQAEQQTRYVVLTPSVVGGARRPRTAPWDGQQD